MTSKNNFSGTGFFLLMHKVTYTENWQSHIPVNAFLALPEDPAGITFNTLNLTVFEIGLYK